MIEKIDRASIKAQAKQQLNGKILMTFLCMFVAGLISVAASQVTSLLTAINPLLGSSLGWIVSIAVTIFVTMPLEIGLTKVYLNITYGYEPSVGMIFEPFSRYYKNSILTGLLKALYEFLWYLPFLFVTVILTIIVFVVSIASVGLSFFTSPGYYDFFDNYNFYDMYNIFDHFDWDSVSKFLVALLIVYLIMLLLLIPYTIIINAYAQTFFVLCEYPDYTPSQCIDVSKAMMRGRRWELFVLTLSFIPWMLLVCITFGLAYIYVGPYMSVTYANYYHKIKEGYVGMPSRNMVYGGPNPPYGPQYGQPMQPGASQYGSNVPYSQPGAPGYGQPMQPQAPGQPVDDPFARFAARSAQPKSETEQVLDQVSHDMMTNFDDYTDANPNGPIQPVPVQPAQPVPPVAPIQPTDENIAAESSAEGSAPTESESTEPVSDVDQALESVSHNMMNNFDDFTDDDV